MHLPLRPIFRQSHPNFINVRTAYASKIWAQLTKNLLAKSSTKRFREYIIFKDCEGEYHAAIPIVGVKKINTCIILQANHDYSIPF